MSNQKTRNIEIIFSVLFAVGLLTIGTQNVMASTVTDENGFTMGYSNGMSQGQIDHQAKIFHIGTICIGQTVAWCNGYTDGYLDGFFSTLPTSTNTHTSTTIIVHRGGEGDKGKGCHDNMTSCDKKNTPPPNPGCNGLAGGGSSCGSSSSPSTPSSPSSPSTPSSGSPSSSSSSSGSSSGSSSSPQPTKLS